MKKRSLAMRIHKARLIPWSQQVAGVANAQRSWTRREGVFLILEDDQGHTGWGEASPLPGYSPDTLFQAQNDLEVYCREKLPCPIDPQGPLAMVAEEPLPAPSAQFALETALCDLAARRLNLPVHVLLGADNPAPIPVQALLTPNNHADKHAGTPADTAAAALEAAAMGFRTFKLKIGGPGELENEIRCALALRRVLGPRAAIRLDANQGFAAGKLEQTLSRFAPARPEFIEEPVAGIALEALQRDTFSGAMPLAADESLQDPVRALKLIESAVCSVFVLKPMALGGFSRCFELARSAHAVGIKVVISHTFGSPVAFAATAELALSLTPPPLTCGLASHAVLEMAHPLLVPQSDQSQIRPVSKPGLGLDLDLLESTWI